MSVNDWRGSGQLANRSWRCGHCGCDTGSNVGYRKSQHSGGSTGDAYIYICMRCELPTIFAGSEQVPPSPYGGIVQHLPESVESAYKEARNCFLVAAYTAASLMCRKLLMNVANQCGAPPDKSFAFYIKYLVDNNYVATRSMGWVDHIREKGNHATHQIPAITKEDATDLLVFTEMLLKTIFEFPEAHARIIAKGA